MQEVLFNEAELAIRDEARNFVRDKVPSDLIKRMDGGEVQYPREYVKALGDAGLLGIRFEPSYGGRGLPWTAEVAALEEVGVLGSSLSCLFSLPIIVGEALHSFGTPEQKERYLAPMLRGDLTCAEALTEPRGGSDFFGATTKAVRDGDHYRLTGQKRFVVGAEGADFFLVYAKTAPDAKPHESLSVFLVDREMGVEVKHVYGLMGTRGGGAGRIVMRDIKVPVENRVGDENAGGMIFNRMMIPERLTSAAGAVGGARAALEVAARYSTKRKAFGQEIMKFQAVNFKVADSITKIDAARALVYATARTVDAGLDARRMVSEAKSFSTEVQWEVVNHAMQIMGGIGYTSVYPIERLLRDARLCMIWTGTNEIMNLLIQHEYYKELMKREPTARNVEMDAVDSGEEEEKVYE